MITLVFSGFLSFVNPVSAEVSDNLISNDNNFEYEFLIDEPDYQKIKITNLETEEVEYLETIYEDNEYSFVATTEEATYDIKSNEKEVVVTNRNTGENEVTILLDDKGISDEKARNSINSIVEPSASWSTINHWYSSKALNTTVASVIAGVIASIYGGPITGIVVTIAGGYASIKAGHAYFHVQQQTKNEGNAWYRRDVYNWYKYHDYTVHLGTTTTQTWRIK